MGSADAPRVSKGVMTATRSTLCALVTSCLLGVATAQDNVLLVIADDLGVDHVGAYAEGSSIAPTPTIDGLASNGVLFRNAWAYPTCSPMRASLNTGRYGFRTGVGTPGARLSTEERTLPEQLDQQGSGYAHAWIGKWHLSNNVNHPTNSGWSHFTGIIGGGVGDYFAWPRVSNGQTQTSTTYATTQIVDDAIGWIGQQSGPWVCVVAFNAPHDPFHAPPANLHTQNLAGLNPATNPLPFYHAMIEALDTELARLLASSAIDLANTNVVFVGDNGTPRQVSVTPFTPNHAKGSAYEGGVGVPLIVSGPAVGGAPREEAKLVSTVDLFSTVCEWCGVGDHATWLQRDSVSFAPLVADPSAASTRTSLYAESFARNSDPTTNGFACARDNTFKLIQRFSPTGVTEEFYDLIQSPFEQQNLMTGTLSPIEQAARDALATVIAAVRDTSGSFTAFGVSSCVGENGIPQITGVGTPRVGQTYDVQLSQGPGSQNVVLTLGCFRDHIDGVPLPFDLTSIGAGPGCALHTSMELQIAASTDASGGVTVSLPFPNLPFSVGATVYHSFLNIDPSVASPLWVTTSSGLAATLGE